MDHDNEKQITLTELVIRPTDLSMTPTMTPTITPTITVAEAVITSKKPTITYTKSTITPTESIIISVKQATTLTESKITQTRSKITPAELKISSMKPRIMLTESIKTPNDVALFVKNHIIRPNQPLFYVKNPKGWFNQFESKMSAADLIEDLTMYYDLLKELNKHDILCCILDVFQNMSMVNKYMYFRSHLLKKISEQERLLELVSDLKLEDKYPSFLLKEMKQLTADKLLEHNLKRLWLQKLPPQVRDILLLSSDSLSSISLLADNIKDLHYLPEVKSSKTSTYQYVINLLSGNIHSKILTNVELIELIQKHENEHGSTNSNDHQVENSEAISNTNSIQKEEKQSCLNRFCKYI